MKIRYLINIDWRIFRRTNMSAEFENTEEAVKLCSHKWSILSIETPWKRLFKLLKVEIMTVRCFQDLIPSFLSRCLPYQIPVCFFLILLCYELLWFFLQHDEFPPIRWPWGYLQWSPRTILSSPLRHYTPPLYTHAITDILQNISLLRNCVS